MRFKERAIDGYLPLVHHLTDEAVLTDTDSVFSITELRGFPWENADEATIHARQEQLNTLLCNISHPSVVWHVWRCRGHAHLSIYPKGGFRSGFAEALDTAYRERLFDDYLYDNRLYLGIEIRPPAALVSKKVGGETIETRLERLVNIGRLLRRGLAAYLPRPVGIREGVYSEIAETLVYAMTGRWRPIMLTTGRMGQAMFSERIWVGREAIEYRGPDRSWYGAAYGMRHYPTPRTWPPGQFWVLLSAPYRHTLYQSFRFIPIFEAQKKMRYRAGQIMVGKGAAKSQARALEAAADQLASSGTYAEGDHCLTLMVFADTMRQLVDVTSEAWANLSACTSTVAREGFALEAALFSLCPGNLRLRPRPALVSSVNLSCFEPLHGYPVGEKRGYWGEPAALFRTSSGEPYRFHKHVGDVGNILICGRAGSGKSTLLAFLLAQAERFGATIVAWDKDRGLKIFITAIGGTYLELGTPSGLAPLKRLCDEPDDIDFLILLLRGCIQADGNYQMSEDEKRRLSLGVRMVMSRLKPGQRWLEEVRAFLGVSADGAGIRLERWCWGRELGGVIDCPEDRIALDAMAMGFDQTKILDNDTARGPVMATLYHYTEKLIDGRRLIFAVDEFWKSLLDPSFRDLVNDKLKTLRKRNSPVLLVTQSPADALRSAIAHTIREQCPSKIMFNCGAMAWEDFGPHGMKFTEPEFRIIEGLAPGSGEFLIKQDNVSVRAQLPLAGLDDEIAVLSGREGHVRLFDDLATKVNGGGLSALLAMFHEERRRRVLA